MGHRLWLPAVAIHRLGVVEIAPSPHHCFRTAHPCAQSVKGSPTEPVLSRSSRQRLGHLHSHFDGGWHVCQAVFPEPQMYGYSVFFIYGLWHENKVLYWYSQLVFTSPWRFICVCIRVSEVMTPTPHGARHHIARHMNGCSLV